MSDPPTDRSHYGAPGFDLRAEGVATLDWVVDYLDRLPELPVLAQVKPGEIRAALPPAAPELPEPFSDVLADLDRVVVPGLTNWQHPRFFSYFSVTSSEPAMLAEFLAAALNQVAFIWRSSPAATELEQVMLDWLAQLLGLPAGWHGHLEDTASTSTLSALIVARHVHDRRAVVFSETAHSSVEKAVRMLALDPRKLPAGPDGALRADAVAAAVSAGDVAAVVATVGTTGIAAVDPVEPIGAVCRDAGVWLHVDAAYAGAAWACPEHRWSQEGVEFADSLVVNPHKWLFVPADCSAIWTRHPARFREAFQLVPEYLRTTDDADSLSDYGPALGRRFRSLKLWAVMRCFGAEAIRERIREAIRLAAHFRGLVESEPGWTVVADQRFSLVCFRRDASDAENLAILDTVNASGEMFITHTLVNDAVALRFAVGNTRTTQRDVELAWRALLRAGAR